MLAIFPSSYFCKVFRHSRQDIRPTQLHPLINNSSVTTKLQDEKQLHRLESLTDETAKNRFSAIFSHSFPTIPRTKKMIFTKLHNKYSPSTHINKKCCYILPAKDLLMWCHLCHFVSWSFCVIFEIQCHFRRYIINKYKYLFII